jgi:GTPase SAR1 family protein
VKVAVELLHRTVPKGLGWLTTWWAGRKLIIVGPSRAGKSTLYDYLRSGLFGDERTTPETLEIKESPQFIVGYGKDEMLRMIVKKLFDFPGQVGAVDHANRAYEKKPHAMIVILDITTPLTGAADRSSGEWFRKWCQRLEALWRSAKKKSPLKSLVVALNKVDKAGEKPLARYKKECEKIIREELHDALGGILDPIPVLPCILVTNPKKTDLVDEVIITVVKAMAELK